VVVNLAQFIEISVSHFSLHRLFSYLLLSLLLLQHQLVNLSEYLYFAIVFFLRSAAGPRAMKCGIEHIFVLLKVVFDLVKPDLSIFIVLLVRFPERAASG
jgi:hypothetical protein